jgi:hypothetical protein
VRTQEGPYKEFKFTERLTGLQGSNEILPTLKAVFVAAKDDYEGGYLRSIRSLVHARHSANVCPLAIPRIFASFNTAIPLSMSLRSSGFPTLSLSAAKAAS